MSPLDLRLFSLLLSAILASSTRQDRCGLFCFALFDRVDAVESSSTKDREEQSFYRYRGRGKRTPRSVDVMSVITMLA